MKGMIMLVLLICIIAFAVSCYRNVCNSFAKYLRRVMTVPAIGIFAVSIISMLSRHDIGRFFVINFIGMLVLFVLSSVMYLIFSAIRKDEIDKKDEPEIKSKKEEEPKRPPKMAIETEDMRKIKNLMGEITQKVKALNVFNAEIGKKISSLEMMADTAISEAYGQIATGYKRGRYLAFYDEIRNKYSNNVDNVVALQCDHIVKKINRSINGRREVVQSNLDDKLKYENLYAALQTQYEKEYKIERMKAISAKVNELTDNSSEIEASLNSGFVLEKSLEEFNRLNLEIESRRDLELKYTDDNI